MSCELPNRNNKKKMLSKMNQTPNSVPPSRDITDNSSVFESCFEDATAFLTSILLPIVSRNDPFENASLF